MNMDDTPQTDPDHVDWQAILEGSAVPETGVAPSLAEARRVDARLRELLPLSAWSEERLAREIENILITEGLLGARESAGPGPIIRQPKSPGAASWLSVAATLAVIVSGMLLCRPIPLARVEELAAEGLRQRGETPRIPGPPSPAWMEELELRLSHARQARWQGSTWSLRLTHASTLDGGAHVVMEAWRGREQAQWEGTVNLPVDENGMRFLADSMIGVLRATP
jgi:hypothetical protein